MRGWSLHLIRVTLPSLLACPTTILPQWLIKIPSSSLPSQSPPPTLALGAQWPAFCPYTLLLLSLFFVAPCGMWGLSFPTRGWTCTPCFGSMDNLNHWITREVPWPYRLDFLVSYILPYCLYSCVWLFSHSIIILKFIHLIVSIGSSFLCIGD